MSYIRNSVSNSNTCYRQVVLNSDYTVEPVHHVRLGYSYQERPRRGFLVRHYPKSGNTIVQILGRERGTDDTYASNYQAKKVARTIPVDVTMWLTDTRLNMHHDLSDVIGTVGNSTSVLVKRHWLDKLFANANDEFLHVMADIVRTQTKQEEFVKTLPDVRDYIDSSKSPKITCGRGRKLVDSSQVITAKARARHNRSTKNYNHRTVEQYDYIPQQLPVSCYRLNTTVHIYNKIHVYYNDGKYACIDPTSLDEQLSEFGTCFFSVLLNIPRSVVRVEVEYVKSHVSSRRVGITPTGHSILVFTESA